MSTPLLLLFKITKGMCLDVDNENFSNETAFYLRNLKLLAIDKNGSTALTNEKGTLSVPLKASISGSPKGIIQCNADSAVLFTKLSNGCYIYKIEGLELDVTVTLLAVGDFKFGDTLQGIFCYENSEIQKVYWVDGVNLLRYLNIAESAYDKDNEGNVIPITEANKLNSTPSYKIDHKIEVERVPGGGTFTAGVILYAFTYFNKNGAETAIVDTTPLYYIGEKHRGLANDESVSCSFKVKFKDIDTSFDYIRLYAIQRTSYNGTPIARIVKDYKINK